MKTVSEYLHSMVLESYTNAVKKKACKGKYRLHAHVFVHCYLDMLEVTPEAVQVLVGVHGRSDTTLPLGTRIYLSADALNKQPGAYHQLYITVLKTLETSDGMLHICSPITHQTLEERRGKVRKKLDCPVLLVDSQTLFNAVDGTPEGLGLSYTAQKAILKLTINQKYDFKINYKGQDCYFQGIIRHIHYDWQMFQHRVGVHFPNLGKDERIILSLMVDPNYKVPLVESQTVDTSQGKISF